MATRRSAGLSRLTHQQLQAELRRRARRAATLRRRRDRLADHVAALDDQIRAMGGTSNGAIRVVGGRGRRPRNEKNLVQSLHDVLRGKTMRVTDLAEAVQAAGYKTSSRSFRVQCNIALIHNPKLFKRVGRGQYTTK